MFNITIGNVGLSYEYLIDESSSVQGTASLLIPRKAFQFAQPSTDADEAITKNLMFGYSFQVEYRRYTAAEAPDGFYVGPWLRFYDYSLSVDVYDNTNDYATEVKVGFRNFSFGFELGNQWVINDQFVIDWTWLGIGIAVNNIYGDFYSEDPSFNAKDIENDFGDVPVLGPKINVSENGERFEMKVPFLFLAWRTALRVGYYF